MMSLSLSSYIIEGLTIKTGDLIATTNGNKIVLSGQFWWLVGKLIPGEIDHIAIYIGPNGLCVEAGATGKVITFELNGGEWSSDEMLDERGFVDQLYGVADPLAGRGFTLDQERIARLTAASYCLEQAAMNKPYNFNFLDSDTETAFYCSQLAYKAYLATGINLNSGIGIPDVPYTESIIFPQEVWEGCQSKTILSNLYG